MQVYNMRQTRLYNQTCYYFINGKRVSLDKYENVEIQGRMSGNFSNFHTFSKGLNRINTKTLTIG